MQKPLISVIIPMFNAEKYIEKCVLSIINSSYKNLEIVIVNDGSKDNCEKICCELAQKYSNINLINQANAGVSSARNLGIKHANGEYIAFVDADDFIEPDYIEALYEPFSQNKNIDLTIGGLTQISNQKAEILKPELSGIIKHEQLRDTNVLKYICYSKFAFFAPPVNKLYRKSKIKQFDKDVSVGEDTIFNLNYLEECNDIFIVDNCGYNYFFNGSSATHVYQPNLYKDLLAVENVIVDYISRKNENAGMLILNSLTDTFYRILRHMVIYNEEKHRIYQVLNEICDTEIYKKYFSEKTLQLKGLSFKRKLKIRFIQKRQFKTLLFVYRLFVKATKRELRKI